MQGQKSTFDSLSEYLGLDHGSTSSDPGTDQQMFYVSDYNSSSNNNITYSNSMSQEGHSLSGWNMGEPSSSNTENQVSFDEQRLENEWLSSMQFCAAPVPIFEEQGYELADIFSPNNGNVNPSDTQMANGSLFLPTFSSGSAPRDLNVSSGFGGPGANDCHNTYRSISLESVRIPFASSSNDPFPENCRLPGKRKAFEGTSGQSSGSGSPNYFQRVPFENTISASDLEGVNPRLGLGVGGVDSQRPIASCPESSRRNIRMRMNASSHQQSYVPSNVFSPGRANISSAHQPARVFQASNSLVMRTTPVAGSTTPNQQPVVLRVLGPRQNLQSYRSNRSSISRSVGSSSVISGVRDSVPYQEPSSRSMSRNISEPPIFVPVPQNPDQWFLATGNTSYVGSNSGVHPSSAPNWVPQQRPSHYSRRRMDSARRSLLSTGSQSGGQSSNFASPRSGFSASVQVVAPSPTLQQVAPSAMSQEMSHSRSAMMLDRHRDRASGINPNSFQTLAAAGEGRSRLVSQIRNVLAMMRRGEGLRFEDALLLDRSILLAMSGIHDRHRDMRLDVDNMSYEELLALGERIGNVKTGLSEETISSRLNQRKFCTTGQMEAEPCCICQEECKIGEDLGTLECGHDFHTNCIKEWLMQKNLCPICKTTALVT